MNARKLGDTIHTAPRGNHPRNLHVSDLIGVPFQLLPQIKRNPSICANWVYHAVWRSNRHQLVASILKRPITFEFHGAAYRYFYHPYNHTWANERTVEVPLAWNVLLNHRGSPRKVLEVGNVLANYLDSPHYVIDKYESPRHGARIDVLEFVPANPIDLIISISTLEHVGLDEPEVPKDGRRAITAIRHLMDCLLPGGLLWFTVPIGYNKRVDEWLRNPGSEFSLGFLIRTDFANRWTECTRDTALSALYSERFPAGNAISVVRYEKQR